VARLLAETSELLQRPAVHKSTLAALLVAAAEDPDADPGLAEVVRVPKADLNDALLELRSEGRVRLTAEGFELTGSPDTAETADRLGAYLEGLVGRKLREWQIVVATA